MFCFYLDYTFSMEAEVELLRDQGEDTEAGRIAPKGQVWSGPSDVFSLKWP